MRGPCLRLPIKQGRNEVAQICLGRAVQPGLIKILQRKKVVALDQLLGVSAGANGLEDFQYRLDGRLVQWGFASIGFQ